MHAKTQLVLLLLVGLAAACGNSQRGSGIEVKAAGGEDRLTVYVVNYPLRYFAERIGGDLADVHFPMTGAGDPAYWSPDPETVAAYQSADVILLNGAGYAKWIDRATLPPASLIDTSASFRADYIEVEGGVSHSHGTEGAHTHSGWAFTTWLDPNLAIAQAHEVAQAFVARRPIYEAIFNERFVALRGELEALDRRQAAAAERIGRTTLVFSHPVYQYLQRRYSLDGPSLHWEPDEAPNLGDLERLDVRYPGWLVWESQPLPDVVSRLEARGIRSIVYDPCASTPATGDFMSVMAANAAALERIAGG